MNTQNFIISCIQKAQINNQDLNDTDRTYPDDRDDSTNSLIDYQSALADSISWHSLSSTPSIHSEDSFYTSLHSIISTDSDCT
ncbi:MAG: hypothetical protein ACK53Y_10655, partial [bacterium]